MDEITRDFIAAKLGSLMLANAELGAECVKYKNQHAEDQKIIATLRLEEARRVATETEKNNAIAEAAKSAKPNGAQVPAKQ